MKAALISVIVPVYNVEKYLHKCINSILNQTYKNLEIILIDDGSTDNSGKICDEYALKDNRIKVIHKENGGLSSARNAGLDICSGDYIGFVDSDDYIAEDMYEYLYVNLKKNNADVAMCNFYLEYQNGRIEKVSNLNDFELSNDESIIDFYLNNNILIGIWNKLFRHDIIKFVKFPIGQCCEDTYIIIDWVSKCKNFIFCSQCKYYYLKRENSLSNRNADKYLYDEVEAFSKILKYALKYNYNCQKFAYKCVVESYKCSLDRLLFQKNNIDEQREILKIRTFFKKEKLKILKNSAIKIKSKIIYFIIAYNYKYYYYLKRFKQYIMDFQK